MRTFLDSKDIPLGENWKKCFMAALKHSCIYVVLISEAALEPMKKVLPTDAKDDNLLLEFETALQLARRKLVKIIPVLIGQRRGLEVQKFDFQRAGASEFPETGSRSNPKIPVRTTISGIYEQQGLFLSSIDDSGSGEFWASRPGKNDESVVDHIMEVCVYVCVNLCLYVNM